MDSPNAEEVHEELRLDLDDLSVESFASTPEAWPEGGTVFGQNHWTCYTQCTCPGCPTCDASCNGSCVNTCAASCNGTCVNTCGDTCDYTCGCWPSNDTGCSGPL
ncbi:MAG TPA: hypothetical protein VGV85_16545, partial [Longimicrobiaceae bacterium]|nr:hypothetical protein [Longimicrobiaceae bacterium]